MFLHRFQQKISDILWAILGNGWICILKYVSWFVSIVLNFNVLCDALTVQRQSYSVLLKSNRISCLIIEITFANCLKVSNDSEDHLWVYFVYFLIYPPMYE